MTLVRWDPFQELVSWSNRLNRTLTDPTGSRTEDAFGSWAPPVDIFEKDENLVIRAEVPGVEKDAIDIRLENGVLTLRGERKQESEINEDNAYRLERTYGAFTRSFSLPTTVDATKIQALYKDGILELRIPKAEAARPKKIEIHAA